MASSDIPACSIWRIFFLFSQQVRQGYGSMRQAILVLQPQDNSAGRRCDSPPGFPVLRPTGQNRRANRAQPANKLTTSKLIFNRRMFLGNSYYLRPGIRQTNFIGDQADDGPEREHPKSDPDPRHQREHVRLDHGATVVGRKSGEIDVEILVQASANRHFRGRLLAGLVETAFGVERAQRCSVTGYVRPPASARRTCRSRPTRCWPRARCTCRFRNCRPAALPW